MFRRGGGNGIAAFLFIKNIPAREYGGVPYGDCDVAVVFIRPVRKKWPAA